MLVAILEARGEYSAQHAIERFNDAAGSLPNDGRRYENVLLSPIGASGNQRRHRQSRLRGPRDSEVQSRRGRRRRPTSAHDLAPPAARNSSRRSRSSTGNAGRSCATPIASPRSDTSASRAARSSPPFADSGRPACPPASDARLASSRVTTRSAPSELDVLPGQPLPGDEPSGGDPPLTADGAREALD
jgi:hypothetical protein